MIDIEQGTTPTTTTTTTTTTEANRRSSETPPCKPPHKTTGGGEDVAVDLESGGEGDVAAEESSKVKRDRKVERDCRICHLSLDGSNLESGYPIELGCCCKEDLGAAHKHCAEAWFKIRGNKTCEICGSIAQNVVGVNEMELMEQWNDTNDTASTAAAVPPTPPETRHFWQGHKFLNFLLACMVFAFVISWLFHFNVPS